MRDTLKGKIAGRPITKREKEILDWLRQGKTSWEISIIIGISEHTVNFHIKNSKNKFDAMNRHHLVALAAEKGLFNKD